MDTHLKESKGTADKKVIASPSFVVTQKVNYYRLLPPSSESIPDVNSGLPGGEDAIVAIHRVMSHSMWLLGTT
jgi:hypothetical protein